MDPLDEKYDFARYYLSEIARDAGQVVVSENAIALIMQNQSAYFPKAIHARIHLLKRQGALEEMLKLLNEHKEILDNYERLYGDYNWVLGNFEKAYSQYAKAFERAEINKNTDEIILCRSFMAWASSFGNLVTAKGDLDRAKTVLDKKFKSFSYILCSIAEFVFLSRQERIFQINMYHEIREQSAKFSHTSLTHYIDFAAFLVAKKFHIRAKV